MPERIVIDTAGQKIQARGIGWRIENVDGTPCLCLRIGPCGWVRFGAIWHAEDALKALQEGLERLHEQWPAWEVTCMDCHRHRTHLRRRPDGHLFCPECRFPSVNGGRVGAREG